MTKLILAVAALVALILPSSATAFPAPTAAGDVAVAEAFWERTPTGCSSIAFSTTPMPGRSGEATQPEPGEAPIACNLKVREVGVNGYTPEMVCAVALHEFGHLLGEGHSSDPSSVMYPGPVSPVPEICRESAPIPGTLGAREAWYEWQKLRRWCREASGPYRPRCFYELRTSAEQMRHSPS